MRKGQLGIIPGSMGTRSYIVSGLENRQSYHSAPHGAGRPFSRKHARKILSFESLEKSMEGIICRLRPALIDEQPDAYKDIGLVMERSKDLVEVKHVLHQILNVKGD